MTIRFRFTFFARAFLFFLVPWVLLQPATMAREVSLTASIVRIENVDEDQIIVFHDFFAETDDYTLEGASGRYDRDKDYFEGYGSENRSVHAVRLGDQPFQVSASRMLAIQLEAESLRAEGDVVYSSEDTHATSDLLVVGGRDEIHTLVAPLIDVIERVDSRTVVLEFFDRATTDDRLVFLQGDVHVDQKDSSLRAEWVVFNESRSDEIVSAAGKDQPLKLRIALKNEEEQTDDEPPSSPDSD